MKNYLNFETEIKNIENEIEKLKDPFNKEGISQVDTKKIDKLEKDLEYKIKKIYSKLDPWQTTLVARHEERPKTKFFIDNYLTKKHNSIIIYELSSGNDYYINFI